MKKKKTSKIKVLLDYIREKAIFVSSYYYPCNMVGCEVKNAILSYEGNNYCMEHFLEFIIDNFNDKNKRSQKMKLEKIPILQFGDSKDDREAIRDLFDVGIDCKFKGPYGDIRTPILTFESKRYIGKNGVKIFIQDYLKNKLKSD